MVSNLFKVLTILEMKFLSFLFCIVLTSAIVLSSIVRDISAGMVLDSKTGSELDNTKDIPGLGPWHAGVEALVDA